MAADDGNSLRKESRCVFEANGEWRGFKQKEKDADFKQKEKDADLRDMEMFDTEIIGSRRRINEDAEIEEPKLTQQEKERSLFE